MAAKQQKPSFDEALIKISRYCAYQERSHLEVKNKLLSWKLTADEADELLTKMITEGFVNEERFAKAFAGGKFRIKKWGRLKIENELASLGVSKNCISRGMREIEASDYESTLRHLLIKKAEEVSAANIYSKRHKLAQFALGKGFEPDLVWDLLKALFPGN